jgi:hypothetical protein
VLETLIEARAVEYKESAPFATLKIHIIKTAMAMANLVDGGILIVGVSGSSGSLIPTGIAAGDLATYDSDRVLLAINKYASPPVDATVAVVGYQGHDYLVISVRGIESTPTICARGSTWGSAGSIFIRPRGFVETRTPHNGSELREVLDAAAEKLAIKMLQQQARLNSSLQGPLAEQSTSASRLTSSDLYDREADGLLGL